LTGYDGFANEATMSTIMVHTVDRAYVETMKAHEANLERPPVSSEDLPQGEHPGRLVLTTRGEGPTATQTWSWMFGDAKQTIVVSGGCSKACDQELDLLEAAVRSAIWDADTPQQSGLTLTDSAGLQVVMQDDKRLLYSSDGTLGGDLRFDVTLVPGEVGERQRTHALSSFEKLNGYVASEIVDVSIDGLEGKAFSGSNPESGQLSYEVVLFDRAGIWYLRGSATKSSAENLALLTRVAKSLSRGSSARFGE